MPYLNRQTPILFIAASALLAATLACNAATALVSTPTVTPMPAPTALLLPTDPASGLPELPVGFQWQVAPEVSLAFPVPDGWYFTAEPAGQGVNSYFVTKEITGDINTAWVYSTGLSIVVIGNRDNSSNMEFAKKLIDDLIQRESTKTVISNSQTEQGNIVSYQLQIEAEYADVEQDNPNREKIVFYTNIVDKTANILYVVTFESPAPIWTEEWKTGELMIDAFVQQLIAQAEQPAQSALANTTLIPHEPPGPSPVGMPPAAQSNLYTTTGGGFQRTATDPAPGDPWQESYILNLEVTGVLPSSAVIEAHFENPIDPATAIVVSLAPIPSGQILLESPLLSGFKCKNYWIEVHTYSDASQTDELGVHVQWINSSADLDKVTSALDFIDGHTCR